MKVGKSEALDKRKLTIFLAYFGWVSTAMIVTLRTQEAIPVQYGTTAILTLGIGVAASLALSRYRLGDTISATFQAGMKSAATLSANLFTDVCVMTLSKDGKILSADRPDAIGWDETTILGRNLQSILAPRSMGQRKVAPGVNFASPVRNLDGEVFDARVSITELVVDDEERDIYIAIVAPSVATNVNYTLEKE